MSYLLFLFLLELCQRPQPMDAYEPHLYWQHSKPSPTEYLLFLDRFVLHSKQRHPQIVFDSFLRDFQVVNRNN